MTDDHIPTMGTQAEADLRAAQEKQQRDGWISRLKIEHHDLDIKGQKLNLYMKSAEYALLPDRDKELLLTQINCMGTYFAVLTERIFRAEHPDMAAKVDHAQRLGGDNDNVSEQAPLTQ